MLEHCSSFPAPSPEAAVRCVTRALLDAELKDSSNFKYTEAEIKQACEGALSDMGGAAALGSQSGWLTFFRAELIKRTKERLEQMDPANAGQPFSSVV